VLTRVGNDRAPDPSDLWDKHNAPPQTKEINMARNTEKQTTTTYEPKAPDFLAWHVTQKGPKSFWNKVGAAWKHKDGQGFTIQLEVVPINGRIVLRQPTLDPATQAIETEKGA
jgi:hypothetical protein